MYTKDSGTQNKRVVRKKPKLGAVPKLGAYPGEDQVKAARAQKAREVADRLPHVPVLENPTHKQREAAKQMIRTAINREVGASGAEGVRRKRELIEDLEREPKAQQFIAASKHYAQVSERKQAQRTGALSGVKGRQAQVAAGREIAAYHQQRDQVKPGRPDQKVSVAGININLSDVARELRKPFERGDLGPRMFAGNALRDVRDLPANAVTSVYYPAREVVKGHPAKAAKMLAEPFIEAAKHPEKAFLEHPLNTALMASGAVRGADLGAGKVVRTATGKRGELAAAVVPGTRLRQVRPAPKGLVGRVVSKRERESPLMSEHEIRRRVDETFAADEDIRRIERSQAVKRATEAVGKKPTAETVLRAQNIVTGKDDLRGYLLELQRAEGSLTGAKRKANRAAQAEIRKALRSKTDSEPGARRYAELSQDLQRQLVDAGLLDRVQEERARLTPYAVRSMGAKHDPKLGLYVERDGQKVPLSNEAIREHMGDLPEPGFVTHAPNSRGARNFFVPTHEPAKAPSGTRTGAAVAEGTADIHPDVLVEGAARAQGLITAAKQFPKFLGEFGYRSKSGKLKAFTSYRQARQAADDLHADHGGHQFVPVRLHPFGAKKVQVDQILERANDVEHPAYHDVWEAFDNALAGNGPESGTWVLIPRAAAEQARAHIAKVGPKGPLQRAGNLYGSQWRRTVLSLSPKWLTGNTVEAAVRSAVAHAGPRSYYTGRQAIKRLEKADPEAAMELRVRATGGGHYALGARSSVHTNADHFTSSKLAPVAVALAKLRRTHGPKELVNLWGAYTDFIMNSLNGRIESQFQTAMLGKALRDSPLMEGHVVKLSTQAIKQAAEGLRDTNEQVAMGRAVDRMYGRYSKFSPDMKRAVAAYTPFAAWSLNAVRFLFDVLPRDHPVLTALLASANEASEEWRKDHGLAVGIDGAVPGWLMGSIPGSGGSHLRVSRYTPFGWAADPLSGTADLVLPQLSNVLAAFEGRDWQGNKLRNPDGSDYDDLQKFGAAVVSLIEGTVPLAAQAHRYADREGSPGDRLRAEFDPFQYTPGRKTKTKKLVKVKRKPVKGGLPPAAPSAPAGSLPPAPMAAP